MHKLPSALSSLKNFNQFIVYRLEKDSKSKKLIKKPINPHTGKVVGATESSAWVEFEVAVEAVTRLGDKHGIGFVLTEDDPFFLLDIDSCWDDTTQQWSPLAIDLCNQMAGAAVEVSSSGKGLHIIGTCNVITHGCRNASLSLELYTRARFIALTGFNATGCAWQDCSEMILPIIDKFFNAKVLTNKANWTSEAVEDWRGPLDDEELLKRALAVSGARQLFGGHASFADLWQGEMKALVQSYPDLTGKNPYNASDADLALASHLAFWTGRNCERIQRLMLKSALARDKWQRESYIQNTILRACASNQNVYQEKQLELPTIIIPTEQIYTPQFAPRQGATFLTPEQQQALFKGCVYVEDVDAVLVPGGILLNHGQFKRRYAGYSMLMDSRNERIKRDAFEVFTESQAWEAPRAHTTTFRPDLPPGQIIVEAGRKYVNEFWPPAIRRTRGNPKKFIRHIHDILPNDRDAEIALAYLAACVQYQGRKFSWCVLFQGVEGNGKTLLGNCVAEAVGRHYAATPVPSKIKGRFNAWMKNCVVATMNEIMVNPLDLEMIELLKNIVTEEYQEIEPKGVDQKSMRVCFNLILNSNYKDAIKKSKNDRRYCPFYTAQQSIDDLHRDGFFTRVIELQNWLRKEDGYAIVAEFLHTHRIPEEFNPTILQKAPITSSTERAIIESRNYIEQEIIEAVEQELTGFRGGWVSSHFLDLLLKNINSANKIPYNRRKDLLYNLGYVYHPGLVDNGRASRTVMPDGVRSRLFIKISHPSILLTNPEQIVLDYTKAQNLTSY